MTKINKLVKENKYNFMEKVQIIINLIIAICSLIPTLVSLVCLIKNIIKNKNWKLVQKIALNAMTATEEYATEHPGMTGEQKLEMALTGVKAGLTAAGIVFDENLVKQVIAYINEMCGWSKTVNKK